MKFILIFTLIFLSLPNLLAYSFNSSEHLLKDAFQRKSLSLKVEKEKRKYTKFAGKMDLVEMINPVHDEPNQTLDFSFVFYLPKTPSLNNLVVVTPTIGGLSLFEKIIAKRLVKEGYPVLIPIERASDNIIDEYTTARMERQVRRAMAASFHEIEALKEKFPIINTESMGLVGASLGGIRSSILFSLDNRFKAAFIAVTGQNAPLIYRDTQFEQLVNFRNSYMDYLGFRSKQVYADYLKEGLYLDAAHITKSEHLKNVALVISNDDTTVSTRSQWQLFKNIKAQGVQPKTFITDGGHGIGAAYLILKKSFLFDWFKKKL